MHNIRVMRNMMVNSASHPLCNQPAVGGPVYWIRNIVVQRAGRLDAHDERRGGRLLLQQHDRHARRPAGSSANVHWREQPHARRELGAGDLQRHHQHQLQLVGLQRLPSEPGRRRTRSSGTRRRGPAAADDSATANPRDGTPLETRRVRHAAPSTRPRRASDRHSVLVDYDVFVNVPKLDAQDRQTVQRVYKARRLDFRLKAGIGRRRQGRRDSERHRRVRRAGAGSRRARSRPAAAELRPSMRHDPASSPWRKCFRAARPGGSNHRDAETQRIPGFSRWLRVSVAQFSAPHRPCRLSPRPPSA